MKKIIVVGRLIKYGILIAFIWSIAEILKLLAPYVENPDLVLDNAFTNSQITAMLVMITLAWALMKITKIFNKKWFNMI